MTTNKENDRLSKSYNKFYIKFIIALFSPLILSRFYYTRINEEIVNNTLTKYNSSLIQNNNYSISTKTLSRKDAALLKLKLISKIEQRDFLLLTNHQLQFFSQKLNKESIFNMWMADYGITQVSDIVSYADKHIPNFFPGKILATAITTPNNDNGNVIIGYGDDMPERIIGSSKNPYILKKSQILLSPGLIIQKSSTLRLLRHTFDYKNLWGLIKTYILKNKLTDDITITKPEGITGNFSFNLTGSATGYKNSPDGEGNEMKIVFNENNLKSKSYINERDINEIVYSLLSINKICNKRELTHIVIIPPVYESMEEDRMNSQANRVLDKALNIFLKKSKKALIIDHRRDKRYLGIDKEKYYYHYDHPSGKYGKELWKEINNLSLSI